MGSRRRYTCPECGEDFGYAEGIYVNHMEVHHGREMPRYGCAVCGQVFMSMSGLGMHQRMHTVDEIEASQRPPPEEP